MDETPLFLSCREGSYQAAKALLDHCANRDITDHMDRLPRDVAQERLHHDIVRLLEEHIPPAPQPQVCQPLVQAQNITTEQVQGQAQVQMTPTKPRPKKRSKTAEGSPMDGGLHSPPMVGMAGMNGMATLPKNRRPSFKKKKDGHDMSGMMMSPDSDHHMYGQLLAASHHVPAPVCTVCPLSLPPWRDFPSTNVSPNLTNDVPRHDASHLPHSHAGHEGSFTSKTPIL